MTSDLPSRVRAAIEQRREDLLARPSVAWAELLLRHCESDIHIADEHAPSEDTYYGDHVCRRCKFDDDEMTEDDLGNWVVWPCPTFLALTYAYNIEVSHVHQ